MTAIELNAEADRIELSAIRAFVATNPWDNAKTPTDLDRVIDVLPIARELILDDRLGEAEEILKNTGI